MTAFARLWADGDAWCVRPLPASNRSSPAVPEREAARYRAARRYRTRRDEILLLERAERLAAKAAGPLRRCRGCAKVLPVSMRSDAVWCRRNCRRKAWRALRRAAGLPWS